MSKVNSIQENIDFDMYEREQEMRKRLHKRQAREFEHVEFNVVLEEEIERCKN